MHDYILGGCAACQTSSMSKHTASVGRSGAAVASHKYADWSIDCERRWELMSAVIHVDSSSVWLPDHTENTTLDCFEEETKQRCSVQEGCLCHGFDEVMFDNEELF